MNISSGISNGRSRGRAKPRHPYDKEFTLFGDTVQELSAGTASARNTKNRRAQMLEDADPDFLIDQPYRNPFKGIGRNDRCLCGSGKKFKNCCLDLTAQLQ